MKGIPLKNKYGKLIILKELKRKIMPSGKKREVLCGCDCGNEVVVLVCNLRSGNTVSCGCMKSERAINNFTKHGKSKTLLYARWKLMRSRVNNKNRTEYKHYGGRGIKICDKWDDFMEFEKDMGKSFGKSLKENGANNTTLERINNNGNYCKENCRWATRLEQANNTTRNVKTKRKQH